MMWRPQAASVLHTIDELAFFRVLGRAWRWGSWAVGGRVYVHIYV